MLRLGVERLALLELGLDERLHLIRGLVEQQRPDGLSHLEMLVEHVGGAFQVDRLALAVDVVDVVEEPRTRTACRLRTIL